MSVWDELAIEENPKGRVMVAKVDCTRHASKHLSPSPPQAEANLVFHNRTVR